MNGITRTNHQNPLQMVSLKHAMNELTALFIMLKLKKRKIKVAKNIIDKKKWQIVLHRIFLVINVTLFPLGNVEMFQF